ncbi:MAG: hypothetical protein KDB79_08310 [Acidobacteria bacterium]|nr:hypothetical protein [Acidobacteriota bacterium]
MSFFFRKRPSIPDEELVKLFQHEPFRAWDLFCEKHSDLIYGILRRMGFDHDGAMERFVYVCEKLCENDFRRLRDVKYVGDEGDLTPWIRQVVKNFCVNWAWSESGRKRLLSDAAEMPERDQRIFQLYFWQGKTPFEIYEALRLEHDKEVELGDVFDALENIAGHLSQKKLWRLISGIYRQRKMLSLDHSPAETGKAFEVIDTRSKNPEKELHTKEDSEQVKRALGTLSTREKIVIRIRYEEGLSFGEIAEMLNWESREAVNLHKSAIYKLRKILK